MTPRILVAGIGNIFLGDDAFGVEVVRRLAAKPWPANVRVAEFGIRGFDLSVALAGDVDLAILVDVAPRGNAPGTLYVIEPDPIEPDSPESAMDLFDPHSLDPISVLRFVRTIGGQPGRVLVVGCEPSPPAVTDEAEMEFGLSAPVEGAVAHAVILVESLVSEACANSLVPLAQ
jgi:hydrogenase maturation protease